MNEDPYTTLGVSREQTLDEIKSAFYKLAHKHHPDKEGGDEVMFKKISSAWAFVQQRHVHQKRAESNATQGRTMANEKTSKNVFYEYDADTGRWYSWADLDEDGYVVPTIFKAQDPAEFKAKVEKLRASRIGKREDAMSAAERFWKKQAEN